MEKAYIIPGWATIVVGLVIHYDRRVLLGLRSARMEAGKWCLPTGFGAIRRDVSDALIKAAPASLEDPMIVVRYLSERRKQALLSPAGFALVETRWYVELPAKIDPEQLEPLRPVCQFNNKSLLVKLYFGLDWRNNKPPLPAKTEWPFAEVKSFSRQELKGIPIAFGCDRDLETVFW